MLADAVLVAYSEPLLKSKGVRKEMEDLLSRHIKLALKRAGLRGELKREGGRFFVFKTKPLEAAKAISKVFGVEFAVPCLTCSSNLEDIVRKGAWYAERMLYPNQTFAVRARRIGEHPFKSKDIEMVLGAEILKKTADRGVKVDLKDPDKEINVEVRRERAYIYSNSEVFKGPGGLPLGSQGKLVALFSGGIDSPVAAWMMMKRGCRVVPVFLNLGIMAEGDIYKRAVESFKKLAEYLVEDFYMYVVPYEGILAKIAQAGGNHTCVVCKRTMYRIAERIARKEKALGIVTGESVGQVASQTPHNLALLSSAVKTVIFRPLVGMNKQEITDLAKMVGTYDVAVRYKVSCKATPKNPTTRGSAKKVQEIEAQINVKKLVEEAVEKARKIYA